MANEILLLDSFDRYAESGVGALRTIWTDNGEIVAGRFFGGKAARLVSGANYGSRAYRFTPQYHQQAVIGAAVMVTAENSPIFTFARNAGEYPVTLWLEPTGRLSAYRTVGGNFNPAPNALIGSGEAVNCLSVGVWHYVEFMCTFGPDGAQIVRAWVDGYLVLEIMDANTWNHSGVDSFGLCGTNTKTSFDDFYARDGIDPLGEIAIESLLLSGDTIDAEFSVLGGGAGYTALNDAIVDNDTSYIYSDVASSRSMFLVSDLSLVPEEIKAVQLRTYARKEGAGYRALRSILRTEGVEVQGTENALSTAYNYHFDIAERSPNGNVPWTPEAINNLTVGQTLYA